MAVTAAQLNVTVQVQGANDVKVQLNNVNNTVKETQSGFKSMLGNALSFATGQAVFNAVGNAVGFLKDQTVDAIKMAMQHQQVMSQTNNVLKSTHDVSGMSAQGVQNLAESLSKVTPFSEDVTESAENMLLTFTNIGKKVFPQATQTALDMAQALHMGPEQASIMLGKALGNPLTGFTALQRVGVTFSDQEKQQIKTAMSHNDIMGAQQVILKELSTEFGGSATAAGKIFSGALDILKNNFDDLKIKIGTAVLPILSQLLSAISSNLMPVLSKFADWFASKAVPALQQFSSTLSSQIGPAVQAATDLFMKFGSNSNIVIPILAGLAAIIAAALVPAVWSLAAGVIAATLPFLAIGVAVAALTAAFIALYQNNAGFKAFIDAVVAGITQAWTVIQANFIPVLQQVGDVIQSQVMPILQDIADWLVSTFQPVWQQLIDVWNSQLLPAFQLIISSAQPLMPLFQAIAEIIGAVVIVALGLLIGIITGVIQAFSNLLSAVVRIIGGIAQIIAGGVAIIEGIFAFFTDLLTGNFSNLGNDLSHIMQGIMTMFSGGWNVIAGIFSGAWGVISGLVSGFVTGIIGFFTHLWDMLVGHSIIPDMINAIVQWFANLPGWVIAHVVALVTGLIAQFTSMQARAVALAQQLINNVVSFFASLPGNVISHLAALVSGASAQFSSMQARAVSIVQGLINNVVSFFSTLPGRVIGAISSLGGMLQGQLSSIAGRAASWGSEIIQNLISGIQGQLGALGNVVSNVAGNIAKFLHFSKPDTGPLADIDTWIPDMTSILETGFKDQASKLGQAASSVASKIAAPLASASPSSGLTPGAALPYQLPALASNTPVQVVVQGPPVYLDGRVMANGLMPHIANAIRYNVGTHSF